MSIAVNSLWDLTSHAKLGLISVSSMRSSRYSALVPKLPTHNVVFSRKRSSSRDAQHLTVPLAIDSDEVASETSTSDSVITETVTTASPPPSPAAQPEVNGTEKSVAQEQNTLAKKSPLTAREKLRAARVLSRYADSKPANTGLGSKVLDALRESDGGKRRPGLPQAPTNMFDDSKRGMPKQGLTFDLPGGSDLFFIALSFVLISTVMFGTTYIVWKVGAIHFNEF